jgi:hypothetical protein
MLELGFEPQSTFLWQLVRARLRNNPDLRAASAPDYTGPVFPSRGVFSSEDADRHLRRKSRDLDTGWDDYGRHVGAKTDGRRHNYPTRFPEGLYQALKDISEEYERSIHDIYGFGGYLAWYCHDYHADFFRERFYEIFP